MGKRGPTAPAPTKPLDDKDFERLIAMVRIQCTQDEICGIFDMSEQTLDVRLKERGYKNFRDFKKHHGDEGKASLRRMQWKSAEAGNVTAQIWLGKQILGQRDKSEFTGADGGPIQTEDVTKRDAESFTSSIAGLVAKHGAQGGTQEADTEDEGSA